MKLFKLDENKLPEECDEYEWATVGVQLLLLEDRGDEMVSTIFLGLDISLGSHAPQMFETMHFPSKRCERCCTYEEAKTQHHAMVVRFMKDVN